MADMVYDRAEGMKFNDALEDANIYPVHYKNVFGPLLNHSEPVMDKKEQFKGKDRKLYLSDGRLITIEEKTDKGVKCKNCGKRNLPDACPTCSLSRPTTFLELVANEYSDVKGCFLTAEADFFVYTHPDGRMLAIPLKAFREQVWSKHGKEWTERYGRGDGQFKIPNVTHSGSGIGVPDDVIREAMKGIVVDERLRDAWEILRCPDKTRLQPELTALLDAVVADYKQRDYRAYRYRNDNN